LCLNSVKDGVKMMKYALSNPDEFSYPISAFFVGFFSFSSVLVGEVINLLNI
jgi:hypothetical protein